MHATNEGQNIDTDTEDENVEPLVNENNVQQFEVSSYKFYKLLKEVEQDLYPGCKKFTKLSFLVHLYHLKCLNGWSDKSFSMLLELLNDALLEENTLPKSFYDTKKIILGLGLGYEKIHACPNDCILYKNDLSNDEKCPKCNFSRWKNNSNDSKFQFVPELSEQTKRILKDNMSNKWRQFKHDLKSKAYDASKTEEEMVANILDKRVDPSQYRDLVHHWCSKKGQVSIYII
uniref:Uncharacterized protein n=1 Tax=Cajanus cajan TaxID=3821 RepID=A0A151UDV1_CAJCA